MKKQGLEGEKERWRMEKKGGVKKIKNKCFKDEKRRIPFLIRIFIMHDMDIMDFTRQRGVAFLIFSSSFV